MTVNLQVGRLGHAPVSCVADENVLALERDVARFMMIAIHRRNSSIASPRERNDLMTVKSAVGAGIHLAVAGGSPV